MNIIRIFAYSAIIPLLLISSIFFVQGEPINTTSCEEKCMATYKACIASNPNKQFECTKSQALCKFNCQQLSSSS